jgi:hypothetical protein
MLCGFSEALTFGQLRLRGWGCHGNARKSESEECSELHFNEGLEEFDCVNAVGFGK